MKKLASAVLFTLCLSSSVFAQEIFDGGTLGAAQSTQNGASNSSYAFSGFVSVRPSAFYGYEFQGGLFGTSGPFTNSAFVDATVVGFLPLGESGFQLYGKAGVADVYSMLSNVSANNIGLTYGGGIEFKRNKGAFRLGLQHYNVGNDSLSPSLSTNLIGISFMSMK